MLPFRSVHDKVHWDGAIKFLSENLTEKIDKNDATLKEMVGPGWYERWTRWRSCTPEQRARSMARVELEKILAADTEHGPHLAYEEVMLLYCTVLQNPKPAAVKVTSSSHNSNSCSKVVPCRFIPAS